MQSAHDRAAAIFIRAMEERDVDFSEIKLPEEVLTHLADYLLAHRGPQIPGYDPAAKPTLPGNPILASGLFVEDFISPEEASRAYGFEYTPKQLVHFSNTLPDNDMLRRIRANGYMLVAGPAYDLNPKGLYQLDEETFDRDDLCSQIEGTEKVLSGQWLILRKNPVPDSQSKNWRDQSALVYTPERVPNATEVCYGLALYRKVRRIWLLKKSLVRTSSLLNDPRRDRHIDGRNIVIGYCSDNGVSIDSRDSKDCDSHLGVLSAWTWP